MSPPGDGRPGRDRQLRLGRSRTEARPPSDPCWHIADDVLIGSMVHYVWSSLTATYRDECLESAHRGHSLPEPFPLWPTAPSHRRSNARVHDQRRRVRARRALTAGESRRPRRAFQIGPSRRSTVSSPQSEHMRAWSARACVRSGNSGLPGKPNPGRVGAKPSAMRELPSWLA